MGSGAASHSESTGTTSRRRSSRANACFGGSPIRSATCRATSSSRSRRWFSMWLRICVVVLSSCRSENSSTVCCSTRLASFCGVSTYRLNSKLVSMLRCLSFRFASPSLVPELPPRGGSLGIRRSPAESGAGRGPAPAAVDAGAAEPVAPALRVAGVAVPAAVAAVALAAPAPAAPAPPPACGRCACVCARALRVMGDSGPV
mmetsp:Transcript_20546/g.65830  ORF Transcript_20546/g.65830 Transcript_20546/m.65830 type:complete len:202 (-) Transcript_20546:201-806(-)